MSARKPFIVGVGGTTKVHSSAEQALAMALKCAREKGAETALFGGADLNLPMYEPEPQAMTEGGKE